MAQTPAKNPLKDKLNDDELDLSISGYKDKEVPVKDIALLKRATKLDLANNKLTGLPKSFATLTHLVKLDLSCNAITELPSNFGELTRLRHLDLYNNKLVHLPLSFHQLTALRWLDLKNNALSPQLAGAAGECLNPRECELCAKRVVAFMARVKEHYDLERTRREQAEKELLSAKQAAEDAERERVRLEKKAKKEQRKLELQERRRIENLTAHTELHQSQQKPESAQKRHSDRDVHKQTGKQRWSFLARLNVLLLLTAVALAAGTVYIHARGDMSRSGLLSALDDMAANLATLAAAVRQRSGSLGDAALSVLSGVSYAGAYAGDLLVDGVVAGYEWSAGRADQLDQYLLDRHGATWRSMKATSATALQSAGELGRAAAERALVLTVLAVQKGWELATDWGAAAWDASGPAWEAVKAAAVRLRDEGGPALVYYAGEAKGAAVAALTLLQTEGPAYAAAAWQATSRAAGAAYQAVAALWTDDAPSYTERLGRLVASVTGD